MTAQPNLQERCQGCGADPGEPCRPHCLGEAEAQRRAEDGAAGVKLVEGDRQMLCVWCDQPMAPDKGGDWIRCPNAGDVCIDCCPCCG